MQRGRSKQGRRPLQGGAKQDTGRKQGWGNVRAEPAWPDVALDLAKQTEPALGRGQ